MPPTHADSLFARIVSRLVRWLRRSIGLARTDPPGTLEAVSDRATLWQIAPSEPGVCCCYQICHRDSTGDLVVTAISIAQLREDLALRRGHYYRRDSDPVRIAGRRPFAEELDDYLESAGGLDSRQISHVFIAAWRSRIPFKRTGTDGIERRAYAVRPLCAIPGDFVGVFGAAAGDRFIKKIAQAIARKMLKITPSAYHGWQEIVSAYDWLDLVEVAAHKVFGQSHVLQPRRESR